MPDENRDACLRHSRHPALAALMTAANKSPHIVEGAAAGRLCGQPGDCFCIESGTFV